MTVGGAWAVVASVLVLAPAGAQPVMSTVSPPGQFGIWQFLGSEQDKASVAPPVDADAARTIFVPSICLGAYPPPGCQTSVTKYEPGQKNWFNINGGSTGG